MFLTPLHPVSGRSWSWWACVWLRTFLPKRTKAGLAFLQSLKQVVISHPWLHQVRHLDFLYLICYSDGFSVCARCAPMTWRPRICPRQDAGPLKDGAFFLFPSSMSFPHLQSLYTASSCPGGNCSLAHAFHRHLFRFCIRHSLRPRGSKDS